MLVPKKDEHLHFSDGMPDSSDGAHVKGPAALRSAGRVSGSSASITGAAALCRL
jgi:hypothetical protein